MASPHMYCFSSDVLPMRITETPCRCRFVTRSAVCLPLFDALCSETTLGDLRRRDHSGFWSRQSSSPSCLWCYARFRINACSGSSIYVCNCNYICSSCIGGCSCSCSIMPSLPRGIVGYLVSSCSTQSLNLLALRIRSPMKHYTPLWAFKFEYKPSDFDVESVVSSLYVLASLGSFK